MTRPVILFDPGKVEPGATEKLHELGFEAVAIGTLDSVAMIPGGHSARFIAACSVLQGLLAGRKPGGYTSPELFTLTARVAVKYADTLLAELAK